MFILGIIPARGNSQTIKDKNIYPICGKPLIEYTIDAAKDSILNDWFVFTDKYTQYKTLDIERPKQLAEGQHNSVVHWLPYAIKSYETKTGNKVDAVCLLQPTSPLRTCNDINKAITVYKQTYSTSLYSGYDLPLKHKNKIFSKWENIPHFQRNGGIFITDIRLLKDGVLWDQYALEYTMPKVRSIDIDTMEDMKTAESLIRNGVFEWSS
jgi:CMP-N,N'-diacetyllegionaminic acid synthase